MYSILIVDDSSFQRRILKKYFAETSFEIILAEDGLKALEVLDDIKPFCIITDLIMPNMDGFELLSVLRERKYNVPVIVSTADIQRTTYERCMALGVFDVIAKPVEKSQLFNLISSLQNDPH